MTKRVHVLKAVDVYWDAVERGEKTFEVRKNNRFFQTGDIVELCRYDPGTKHPAPAFVSQNGLEHSSFPIAESTLRFRIGPILQGGQLGIEQGYCVFSLLPLDTAEGANDD